MIPKKEAGSSFPVSLCSGSNVVPFWLRPLFCLGVMCYYATQTRNYLGASGQKLGKHEKESQYDQKEYDLLVLSSRAQRVHAAVKYILGPYIAYHILALGSMSVLYKCLNGFGKHTRMLMRSRAEGSEPIRRSLLSKQPSRL